MFLCYNEVEYQQTDELQKRKWTEKNPPKKKQNKHELAIKKTEKLVIKSVESFSIAISEFAIKKTFATTKCDRKTLIITNLIIKMIVIKELPLFRSLQ